MKLVLVLLAATFPMMALPCAARAEDKRAAATEFKGVELYSWKDKEGNWLYVLASGTNDQKSAKDVKAQQKHKGTADLKKALALLAAGEQVIWSDHRLIGFEFPPLEARKEITKAAEEAKITLVIDLNSPIEPSLIKGKINIALGEEFAIEFNRDGDELQEPVKVKAADAKKPSVHVKLAKTEASPFPPPRAGATRPFLYVDNNLDKTLSFRVLIRKKDPNNKQHAAFEKLSNARISLAAGEATHKCWGFDSLIEEVILYDFKVSDE